MITIPFHLRKKHRIAKGTEVAVVEIDGNITIIPVLSKEELEASRTITLADMGAAMDESTKQDLELER
ncbi:MAG: AbrB/MazE/SpoVT family DNA-binding domain-containing protein [Candidatus Lokiarchaeota archaeon]|nr:AbrB/MazE/SpoVT family DNA-binding domain-containing protein [Candidatus Lokiarchaeota archaeon]